jgi:serine/threonine protein kinase
MVMEYCPGGELLSIIKKQPDSRLTEDQVRFYASEVVLVLEYVHSRGYIYRGWLIYFFWDDLDFVLTCF